MLDRDLAGWMAAVSLANPIRTIWHFDKTGRDESRKHHSGSSPTALSETAIGGLAMLRRLHREEGAEGNEYVEAVVLDDLSINELAIFEMEQREQLTEDYKVRYTDINLLLAIKAAAEDKEIDWYDDESITTVAGELQHVMRDNPAYAVVQLYAIKIHGRLSERSR